MLAGEITNMRNAMYTRYTYFIMFLYICAKRRGNSLQISHWVRPGPCAVTCVCAPVVIIGPVAGLKINFFGICWISFRVGSVPVRINIVPRQKDEQCGPQDEQKMRLGCLTSLTVYGGQGRLSPACSCLSILLICICVAVFFQLQWPWCMWNKAARRSMLIQSLTLDGLFT